MLKKIVIIWDEVFSAEGRQTGAGLMIILFFEIKNAEDYGRYEKYLPLVSAERRERVKRTKSPKAKTVCLLAEVLMRREIGKALGMKEEDIRFSYTEQGKPYIGYDDYHFSISHTENVIVFTDSSVPVGIDIEGINPYRGSAGSSEKKGNEEGTGAEITEIEGVGRDKAKKRLKVAERFFTEREFESVKNAPFFDGENEDGIDREFCRIWTMKEAYVKMTGRGLLIPLNSFDVDNMESKVYYHNMMYKGYSISVCREGEESERVQIAECGI